MHGAQNDEEKDFFYEQVGPKNDLLGTICEVVMSEMYENSSIGDIENEEGSFSSNSNDDSDSSIMQKLNTKLKLNSHYRDNPKTEKLMSKQPIGPVKSKTA